MAEMFFELNNGVKMPSVGFGTYLLDEGAQAQTAVQAALEAGYRHIDTAAAYKNEKSVGRAVRDSGIPRGEIFVTSKVWNDDVRQGRTREAFEKSMDLLGLDTLDLYLIHWPAEGYAEAWLAMEELYGEGRIRAIGVSNFQRRHLEALLEKAAVAPAVNQIECHPYLAQEPLRGYCAANNILCEAWRPLGGGGGGLLEDAAIVQIAAGCGRQPAQVVLRWLLQSGLSSNAKSTHEERMRQNFDIFDFVLSESDMATLDGLDRGRRFGPDPDNFSF